MNSTRPDAPCGARVQALLHWFEGTKPKLAVFREAELDARASIQIFGYGRLAAIMVCRNLP